MRIPRRRARTGRRSLVLALAATLVVTAVTLLSSAGSAAAATAGNVTGFTQSGSTYTISSSSGAAVRVSFARADIFRIWLAPTGTFTDPAGTDIAMNTSFGTTTTTSSDAGAYYEIVTSAVRLRVNKSPMMFSAYRPDGSLLWQESAPTAWTGSQTTQYLAQGANEQYYGTGLRLGSWALRGLTVPISVSNNWQPNSNASPAPFYMSSNGYGVLRNTWAPGSYAFTSPVATTENENRFDAYYFVGSDLKGVLNAYTDVTGKPFLAPEWGLELGNADCFNASNPSYTGNHSRLRHQTTPDVVGYAQDARNANMPSGWFLPNDGYGCGYTSLQSTVSSLNSLGFHTGLWTSTGLNNISTEVGVAGTRGVKTDVAWIGGGYKYAFDGVNQAVAGIENNSDARRFVWTVDGWAGTQRNAIVWTGDTNGDWTTMGWTVPSVVGAGLSGLNYASGDVDGIYGGSPETFTRDLQWKAWTPAFMTMSGWGATNPTAGYNDKQPWRFSDPYLSANRKALQTKMRLMPYMYTMSHVASTTGVPSTRALVLEYPNDPTAQGNATSGEFMAGDSFLIAPVTSSTTTRNGVYLPAGTWTDYRTGQVYQGPTTLNGVAAPLDSTPTFVRGGAIVPMWPQMNYTGEKPVSTLTYDLYPSGNSSFNLYEDDGITRAYQTGASANQQVTVSAPAPGATGDVTVGVGASVGSYTGKPASRGYELTTHLAGGPSAVTLGSTALTQYTSKAAYDAAATGWFFDPADRGGLLWTKVGSQSTAFTVTLTGVKVSGAGAGTETVSVTNPGNQTSTVNTAIANVQVNASDSQGKALTYSATGLPAGLSISSSGLISGTPTTAGTSSVVVTATSGTASGTTSFTWTVGTGGGGGPIVSGGIYEILQSTRAIDDPASSTTPGTQLIVYGLHGGPNQRWTFTANPDNTYSIRNGSSALCIDVAGASNAAGAGIVQQTCANTASQHWTVAASGSSFNLVNQQSGLVITASGTTNSSPLTQQTNTNTALQLWTFTKVG